MEKVAGGTPTPRDVWWGNAVVPDCTGEKKNCRVQVDRKRHGRQGGVCEN